MKRALDKKTIIESKTVKILLAFDGLSPLTLRLEFLSFKSLMIHLTAKVVFREALSGKGAPSTADPSLC